MQFLRVLENVRTPFLDNLMMVLTQLGGEIVSVVLIIVLYYCINKQFAMRFTIAFCYSGILIQGIKLIFKIQRPWVLDTSLKPVEAALSGASGYSFPSAHSFQAAVLGVMLASYITGPECNTSSMKKIHNKIIVWIITIIGILTVMFTRLYLGVHTPKDVITGCCIGCICAVMVIVIYRRYLSDGVSNIAVVVITSSMFILAVIVTSYAIYLYKSGITEYKNSSDAVKMCATSIGVMTGWIFERSKVSFSTKSKGIGTNILKVAIGIIVVLAIKEGLKFAGIALYKENLILDLVRYVLAIFTLVGIYPILIKKYFSSK